jgi:hypothetical protein
MAASMDSYREHRVWWDEESEVVRAVGLGPIDEDAARWFLAQTERMAQEQGDGLDWLLDLSRITKTTAKARKLIAQACAHPSIHKYAMVGASTFLRTVANFISAAAGQTNNRHFATEADAWEWIQEKRESYV